MTRYANLLWSLARRHGFQGSEAEDAVQDIFIDLWKSAERFDASRASELTFICMIARRRLIDRRRRIQRRPQADSLDDSHFEISDGTSNHPEVVAEVQMAAKAIARLKPKERDVVLLSTYHGMSHGQIADHTGLPLGTVKTYVRRGLMRVREMLKSGEHLQEQPT